jgi:serine/threonine protein kinase
MSTLICPICQRKKSVEHAEIGLACSQHKDRLLMPISQLSECQDNSHLGLILDDKYELHNSLGKGGFGAVYFAIQKGQIRQEVAVKLLTRQDPEYLDLFKDEMRVISKLRSPYTVRYLDSGIHQSSSVPQELPYMVMEYLKGETLAHRLIKKGVISIDYMAPLMMNLLESLSEAHDYGIVHRDLKPLNLMITPSRSSQEKLIVLDFGVARVASQDSREATRNRIMGTPYYLAPEVLIQQQVDIRGDLFAAAVIFYEALSCRSPFLNEELSGIEPYLKLRTLYRDGHTPDPLPRSIEYLTPFFHKALAIDPQDRFTSAEDMQNALQKSLKSQEMLLTPKKDRMNEFQAPSQKLNNHQPKITHYDQSFDDDEETTLYVKNKSLKQQVDSRIKVASPTLESSVVNPNDITLMNMPSIDHPYLEDEDLLDSTELLKHNPALSYQNDLTTNTQDTSNPQNQSTLLNSNIITVSKSNANSNSTVTLASITINPKKVNIPQTSPAIPSNLQTLPPNFSKPSKFPISSPVIPKPNQPNAHVLSTSTPPKPPHILKTSKTVKPPKLLSPNTVIPVPMYPSQPSSLIPSQMNHYPEKLVVEGDKETLPILNNSSFLQDLSKGHNHINKDVTQTLDFSELTAHEERVSKKIFRIRSMLPSFIILIFMSCMMLYLIYPDIYQSTWNSCALYYHKKTLKSQKENQKYTKNPKGVFMKSGRAVRACYREESECIDQRLTCEYQGFMMNQNIVQRDDFHECVKAGGCQKKELDRTCTAQFQQSYSNLKSTQLKALSDDFCLTLKSAREYCQWHGMSIPSLNAWLIIYQNKSKRLQQFEWVDTSPYKSGMIRFVSDQETELNQYKIDIYVQPWYLFFPPKLHARARCIQVEN